MLLASRLWRCPVLAIALVVFVAVVPAGLAYAPVAAASGTDPAGDPPGAGEGQSGGPQVPGDQPATPGTPPVAEPPAPPKPPAKVEPPRVAVFIYHEVAPGGKGQYVVTPERLREDLSFLLAKGWRPLDYDTFAAWYRGEVQLTGRWFLLTFDDGYEMCARHALPVLQELNVPAVLFLTTGRLDVPHGVSSDAIRALAASGLVSIQGHTHDLHYQVASGGKMRAAVEVVSAAELSADLALSNRIIAGLTGGVAPTALAWPYGAFDAAAAAVAREHYALLFGTVEGLVKPGASGPIPRIGLDWRPAEQARRAIERL